MMTTEYLNPFNTWGELASGLRDRFLGELRIVRETVPPSAYTGTVLGELAGLRTQCRHLGAALEELRQHDPPAYDAFLRALESA